MPNKYTCFSSLLLCGLAVALGAPAASAEELSVDQMVCALDPGCALAPVRRMRGITVTANAVRPGSFDQQIMFAFNSAELTPEARKQLDKVAEALSNPRVASSTFIIHGHTDAVGGAEYNRVLSQQRAEAARQYFIKEHGIDPSRLKAAGHGKTQLLLPDDPNNERNRRVQFENPHYAEAAAVMRPAPAAETPPAAKRPAGTPATPTPDGL